MPSRLLHVIKLVLSRLVLAGLTFAGISRITAGVMCLTVVTFSREASISSRALQSLVMHVDWYSESSYEFSALHYVGSVGMHAGVRKVGNNFHIITM